MLTSAFFKSNMRNYFFENIFDEDSNQEKVFQQTGSKMCEAFLEGKNCNMIVYGPTSTGKTYTMQGDVQMKVNENKVQYLFNQ